MTELNEIYKCNICGNIVEVLEASFGELVCCNEPMDLLEIQDNPDFVAKHLPVIEKAEDSVTVKLGEVEHPMEEDHYINFIELCVDDQVYRKNLNPGDAPEATFNVTCGDAEVKARSYCNLHGLWKKE